MTIRDMIEYLNDDELFAETVELLRNTLKILGE